MIDLGLIGDAKLQRWSDRHVFSIVSNGAAGRGYHLAPSESIFQLSKINIDSRASEPKSVSLECILVNRGDMILRTCFRR